MRKKSSERSQASCSIKGPTMDRPFNAIVGYGGFVPGKQANNVLGCTHAAGSRLARDLTPLSPCGSGALFTLGLSHSQSLPSLKASGASSPAAQKDLQEEGYASPPRRSNCVDINF